MNDEEIGVPGWSRSGRGTGAFFRKAKPARTAIRGGEPVPFLFSVFLGSFCFLAEEEAGDRLGVESQAWFNEGSRKAPR